jgi:hypothetical protein
MTRSACIAFGLCALIRLMNGAEISYQETTKITGGSLTSMMKFAGAFSKDARKLGQPVITTVAVKGNQMARVTQDYADITDLDAQTITHIDMTRHEYSVMTFTQMREAMQRALDRAKAEQAKASAQPQAASQPVKDPNVQLGFEAHVRKTGATKQVSGIDTNEVILALAVNGTDKSSGQQGELGITNDMWMAPDVPGYAEVRDFERRFAIEMGSTLTTGPDLSGLVQQAQSSEAMKAMAKEMSQIQGVPVLQIMRMGMTANGQPLAAASEAPLPESTSEASRGDTLGAQVVKTSEESAQQTAAQEASQGVRGALGSSLGSAIGGFGGFGRKKKQSAPQQTAAAAPSSVSTGASAPQSAVLMESTTELGNFNQHVDPSLLKVPAGCKLVPATQVKQD